MSNGPLVVGPEASNVLDISLVEHLLHHYQASPNAKKGYPLARAVYARHLDLIRLLLRYGADPSEARGWSVIAAIGNGDLEVVRLLLEGENASCLEKTDSTSEEEVLNIERGRKRKSLDAPRVKRRRIDGECRTATREMLEVAVKGEQWEIVQYLRQRGESRPQTFLVNLHSLTCLPQVLYPVWRYYDPWGDGP